MPLTFTDIGGWDFALRLPSLGPTTPPPARTLVPRAEVPRPDALPSASGRDPQTPPPSAPGKGAE
jgi:hypothetical protein